MKYISRQPCSAHKSQNPPKYFDMFTKFALAVCLSMGENMCHRVLAALSCGPSHIQLRTRCHETEDMWQMTRVTWDTQRIFCSHSFVDPVSLLGEHVLVAMWSFAFCVKWNWWQLTWQRCVTICCIEVRSSLMSSPPQFSIPNTVAIQKIPPKSS